MEKCPFCHQSFKGVKTHMLSCPEKLAYDEERRKKASQHLAPPQEEIKPSPRSSPFQNEENRVIPWVEGRSKEQKEAKERYLENYSKKEKKSPW